MPEFDIVAVIERYGRAVANGEMDRATAARRLAAEADGRLGSRPTYWIDHWERAYDVFRPGPFVEEN